MEESLQIRRFDEIPTAEEFASQIEPTNVPAVFNGCVKHWKAFSKWKASSGGLDYLQELVGSTVVEAMLSESAPVFYGDIRSHQRVPLPFSTFIGYCKDRLQCEDDVKDSVSQLKKHIQEGLAIQHVDTDIEEGGPDQIYLAQVVQIDNMATKFSTDILSSVIDIPDSGVPIFNAENEEKVQLECLKEDIEMPAILDGKVVASVNLWMNSAQSRSSTHYDPHHNLLCIVSGFKQVTLWPPSASPFLYPMPLYGEASNHSAVALGNPDISLYPRAKSMEEYSQKVTLQAGDALFIPEGWFHQVDSRSSTIAVNFWWQSDMMSRMLEHMDAYYLRRILKRLTDKEMDQVLSMPKTTSGKKLINGIGQSSQRDTDSCDVDLNLNNQNDGVSVKKPQEMFALNDLEPHELQSLHELVSLVHDRVNPIQPTGNTPADQSDRGEEVEVNEIVKANIFNLEEDPIANVVRNLEPHTFQSIFLALAHNFPRTLEALILHALSPVGIEALTRKFEQMDQTIATDDRSQFYQKFYSVFDNQSAAMDALLNGKESFACEAFKNVLVKYLGINIG